MSEIEKVAILCEEVYNPSEIFNLLKQTIKLETVEIYSISRTTQNLNLALKNVTVKITVNVLRRKSEKNKPNVKKIVQIG